METSQSEEKKFFEMELNRNPSRSMSDKNLIKPSVSKTLSSEKKLDSGSKAFKRPASSKNFLKVALE